VFTREIGCCRFYDAYYNSTYGRKGIYGVKIMRLDEYSVQINQILIVDERTKLKLNKIANYNNNGMLKMTLGVQQIISN
jgi:hypothetical protein